MVRLNRLGRVLGFLLLQAVLAAVLLEGVGRLFDPLGVSYYPETARYLDTLILEEPIGYRNRPGLDGRFYGVPIHINAIGLRDRVIGAKEKGEYRILALGDSVPFGIGVSTEEAYPRQLERLLAERHPGRRFRVVNMGVPSYNTEQERIQLETLGLALEPDAVTLLFSPNDIEPKLWVFEKRRRWYADLAQRSYAASLLFLFFRQSEQRLAELAIASAYADTPVPAGGVAFSDYRPGSPRWRAVDRALTGINRQSKARNIPFILFTNQERPAILSLLEGVARRERFPLVDLKRQEDPRWAGQDERLFHNSVTDAHPSALGHAALATLMAENLEHLFDFSAR